MSEPMHRCVSTISDSQAMERWEQSLQLLDTFTQIWLDNPKLARQAGSRVQEFVMPLEEARERHLHDLD
ncbi:MAG: hypothetical protein EOO28_10610 [Comamonadaceae bacterium]|nr:MAG: hypothetical protein EOO28_10610 [Comamonadaceae bacterium]